MFNLPVANRWLRTVLIPPHRQLNSMDPKARYEKAAKECKNTWDKCFLTPIIMMEWLVRSSNRTWEDFLRRPDFKKERDMLKKIISDAEELDLRPLGANNTGACTSWAVLITSMLEGEYNFGDKNRHRAAWHQDGLVIDSSAREALQLVEGPPRIKWHNMVYETSGHCGLYPLFCKDYTDNTLLRKI